MYVIIILNICENWHFSFHVKWNLVFDLYNFFVIILWKLYNYYAKIRQCITEAYWLIHIRDFYIHQLISSFSLHHNSECYRAHTSEGYRWENGAVTKFMLWNGVPCLLPRAHTLKNQYAITLAMGFACFWNSDSKTNMSNLPFPCSKPTER